MNSKTSYYALSALAKDVSLGVVFSALQTDSPVSQAANRRSGDAPAAPNPIARQRTAPVFVPGSLNDTGHLQVCT